MTPLCNQLNTRTDRHNLDVLQGWRLHIPWCGTGNWCDQLASLSLSFPNCKKTVIFLDLMRLLWNSQEMIHVKQLWKLLKQQETVFIVINFHSQWETEVLCERHYHMFPHTGFGSLFVARGTVKLKCWIQLSESNIFISVMWVKFRLSP